MSCKCKDRVEVLTENIREWSKDKGLDKAEPSIQMLKLAEEVGELAEGIVKNRPEQIKDSIGDVYVVLTILSQQLGLRIEDCIELAYNEIKEQYINWILEG